MSDVLFTRGAASAGVRPSAVTMAAQTAWRSPRSRPRHAAPRAGWRPAWARPPSHYSAGLTTTMRCVLGRQVGRGRAGRTHAASRDAAKGAAKGAARGAAQTGSARGRRDSTRANRGRMVGAARRRRHRQSSRCCRMGWTRMRGGGSQVREYMREIAGQLMKMEGRAPPRAAAAAVWGMCGMAATTARALRAGGAGCSREAGRSNSVVMAVTAAAAAVAEAAAAVASHASAVRPV